MYCIQLGGFLGYDFTHVPIVMLQSQVRVQIQYIFLSLVLFIGIGFMRIYIVHGPYARSGIATSYKNSTGKRIRNRVFWFLNSLLSVYLLHVIDVVT